MRPLLLPLTLTRELVLNSSVGKIKKHILGAAAAELQARMTKENVRLEALALHGTGKNKPRGILAYVASLGQAGNGSRTPKPAGPKASAK